MEILHQRSFDLWGEFIGGFMSECTPEEKKSNMNLLTELKIAVFGNGNKENSLLYQLNAIKKSLESLQKQFLVIEILLGIVIISVAPHLLTFLRGL